MGKFGEPWGQVDGDVCDKDKMVFAKFFPIEYAQRARECVNAIAGIENVAEWVTVMKEIEAIADRAKFDDKYSSLSVRTDLVNVRAKLHKKLGALEGEK